MAIGVKSRASAPAKPRPSASISQDEVARVAYELFMRRGGIHGSDLQDWLEAEEIVRQRRRASQSQ